MDHNSIGVDRESEGQDMDERTCPCEACNHGEYRAQEMCQGCTLYDSEGRPIDG